MDKRDTLCDLRAAVLGALVFEQQFVFLRRVFKPTCTKIAKEHVLVSTVIKCVTILALVLLEPTNIDENCMAAKTVVNAEDASSYLLLQLKLP